MKKLFLAAAGLFLAATAQADTPPVAMATPATPVMATSDYATSGTARRGMFARLRGRTTTNARYTDFEQRRKQLDARQADAQDAADLTALEQTIKHRRKS